VGRGKWSGIAIDVPALLPPGVFERAQAAIARNRDTLQGRPGPPSPLRGLVYCGACGRRMHVYRSHGRARYRCPGRDRLTTAPCAATSRSGAVLERRVRETIDHVLRDPDLLMRKISEHRTALEARQVDVASEVELRAGEL